MSKVTTPSKQKFTEEVAVPFVTAFARKQEIAQKIYSETAGAVGKAKQGRAKNFYSKGKQERKEDVEKLNKAMHDYAKLHYLALEVIKVQETEAPGGHGENYYKIVINQSFFSKLVSEKKVNFFSRDQLFAQLLIDELFKADNIDTEKDVSTTEQPSATTSACAETSAMEEWFPFVSSPTNEQGMQPITTQPPQPSDSINSQSKFSNIGPNADTPVLEGDSLTSSPTSSPTDSPTLVTHPLLVFGNGHNGDTPVLGGDSSASSPTLVTHHC